MTGRDPIIKSQREIWGYLHMTSKPGDAIAQLSQDLSDVKIAETASISLYDDFPDKEQITFLSDLRLLQLALARQAIAKRSGYLGEGMEDGRFLETGTEGSSWEIYHLNDGSGRVAVLWSHFDDDSWSVFFKSDNLELDFLVYEN